MSDITVSKYLRVYAVTADSYGIDPLRDKVLPYLLKINEYTTHPVTQDERGSPDLIARREYQTEDMWWIILAYNGISSYKDIIEGVELKIPKLASVVSAITDNSIRPNKVSRVITI